MSTRRRWLVAFALVVAAGAVVAAGLAYYVASSTAGSSGRARAAFLPIGSRPTLSVSGRDVTVMWAQNSVPALGGLLGAQAHGGYTITRYAESAPSTAITPGANCSGTRAGNSDPLTCAENSLPTGRWKYTATPSYYNWIGGESSQSLHAIIAPGAPSTVTLTNGGGVGSAYINAGNEATLAIDVALPGTSLSSDTVTVSLIDGVHAPITVGKPATAGAGSVSFTGIDASTLSDGPITISATSTSSYGDASAATQVTRTKDTVAPAVHVTASRVPDSNGWYNHAVTFSASTSTDTGGSGIQSCDADVVYSTPDTGSGSKSFSCTDLAGNSAFDSIGFKYDGTKPTVSLAFPASNGVYSATSWAAGTPISGTATDATSTITGASAVTLTITQTSTGKTWNGSTFATGANTVNPTTYNSGTGAWSYGFASAGFNVDDTYAVAVTAADAANNSATAASNSFLIDKTAPVVTLTAPGNSATGVSTMPTFAGAAGAVAASSTASADSTTVTVNIYTGATAAGTPVQTLTATRSGGAWSVAPTTALSAGSQYTAQAAQSDGAGNVATSTASTFTTANANNIVDLYAEVQAYNAGHTANVSSNVATDFSFFGAAQNLQGGSINWTAASLTTTTMTYSASSASNGVWSGVGASVGPFATTPFNGVTITPGPTNGGGNQGHASVVKLTIPAPPSGSYQSGATIQVHAQFSSGSSAFVYLLDGTGSKITGATNPAQVNSTTTENTTFSISTPATGAVYYVAVAPQNSTTTKITLDVTATLPYH